MKCPSIQTDSSLEILYVYCGRYHNIHNVGLSLSSQKQVIFDGQKLIINDSANYNNIFPDRIQSVTCLVGKNGSGKSSFLELLGLPLWDLSLLSNDEEYCFKVYLLAGKHYLIEELCAKGKKSIIANVRGTPMVEKGSRCILYLCEYNNGIFKQISSLPTKDLSKLLSNLQFYYKTKRNYTHSSVPCNMGFIRNCYNPSQIGFEQQYRFLCGLDKKNRVCGGLLYDAKTYLCFQLRNDVNLGLRSLLKSIDEFDIVFEERLQNVKSEKTIDDDLKPRCSEKNDCICRILANLIDYLIEYANITALSSCDENNDYGKYLEDTLASIINIVNNRMEKSGADAWEVSDFLARLEKLPKHCFTHDGQVIIPTTQENKYALAFLTLWDVSFNLPSLSWLHKCFELRWCCLSDGEEQFINETYSLCEVLGHSRRVEHAVILLDEPDNMMHPETARCYLSYLYNALRQYKNERTTFQIIIVTHSPLILSDLPKSCVHLLRKDDNGRCIAEQPVMQTFAANIHSLLAQSFFLNSTIGAYSEQYIQGICQNIQEISPNDSQAIKTICKKIDLIGEGFIRIGLRNKLKDHLLSMRNEHQGKDNSLQKLIEQLSEEL